jgi:hypothetical protein
MQHATLKGKYQFGDLNRCGDNIKMAIQYNGSENADID